MASVRQRPWFGLVIVAPVTLAYLIGLGLLLSGNLH